MPFPFFFLAIALALGILFSELLSLPLLLWILGFFGILLLAWLFYSIRKNYFSFLLVLIATFFLGASLHFQEAKTYESTPLRHFEAEDYVDIYGKLYRSPSSGKDRTYLFLEVEKIRSQDRLEEIRGRVKVTVSHPSQYPPPFRLFTGDKIKVSARIYPDHEYRNFGPPRTARLRKIQRIHKTAFTKSSMLVEKNGRAKIFALLRLVSLTRQKFKEKVEKYFSSPDQSKLSEEGAVLEALLLGERGRMEEETGRSLQQSGLYHLIAISGAHIAILTFLLFSILRLLPISRNLSYWLLIIVLVFYALLVEGRASVFRATVMAVAFLLGKLLWKDTNPLNTISLSAFILLLLNPFSLFEMGFQLTFTATLSIVLFFRRVMKFLPRLPFRLTEVFVLSLTAQAGVLPFLAKSFNRITLVSLLSNFAAIPLVGLIMALGYAFLFFSFLSSLAANLLAKSIHFLLEGFLAISRLSDYLPILSYRIPTPHLVTIIGYFLFFFLLLTKSKFKGQKAVISLCFAFFLAVLIIYPFPADFSKNLKVTFIDVGQGDSILVEFPGRKKMLIDGGGTPDDSFDVGEHVVSPFLWQKAVKKIDYLVLTHAHPDHLNGLKAVARNFKVGEFWETFSPLQSLSYEELRTILPPSYRQRRTFRGFLMKEGTVKVEALHPKERIPFHRPVSNEESLVLRLLMGDVSFLFTADIGQEAEREISDCGFDLEADILKSPHHGSRSSSSPEFLNKVHPQVVVISLSRGNIYGVPHQVVLDRYRAGGARIFRTDEEGAVEITTDGEKIAIRTAREESR